MGETKPTSAGAAIKGMVYGDLVGSPYMIENTYNRYFDLGESRRAYSRGRVRSFFPEVTEVSHGAAAVCRWLSVYRDSPTAEALQRCLRDQYDAHPRGGWTEPTRLFLTSGMDSPSGTPDWPALTRSVPIASFFRDDLFRAMDLAEACVRATCSDEDTAFVAKAVTHALHMARDGAISAEIFTTMEMQYGLNLSRLDDDLRAELRGEVRESVEMLGSRVEGAYRYRMPDSPSPPSARLVAEAALRAVVRSDSWEDAVRRAVAFGGPSNAVAGIAGSLAAELYGEVTPAVVGKLFTYIPTDISHTIESLERGPAPAVRGEGSPYEGIGRDAVTIIGLGGGRTVYVVPEDRTDIRAVIRKSVPDPKIITPAETEGFLSEFRETRQGTYAYGPRPEIRTLYVQDGEKLVSPSSYTAPGMPPLQERKRHLAEFLSLRSWCIDRQREMNAAAGNPGAGQIHYGDAYHMWIGSRRIDFMIGDKLAGRIVLDERGLMKLELGEWRSISQDARFTGHREQAWAARELFTIPESADPMGHLSDIRDEILRRLLDEGMGDGLEGETDPRYLSEDERRDRCPVSNIDRLEQLSPDEDHGSPVMTAAPEALSAADGSATAGKQPVRVVYTIGYGTRSQEGFINTLGMLGVDTVIDVRSIPRSRYAPQFDADTIYEALSERGTEYFLAGDRMGGRPSDASLYGSGGLVDWEALRRSATYREGIAAIEEMAGEGRMIAVVCREGDPLSCHRFGTVSRDLAARGLDVRHVLTNGEVVSHAVMEDRLLSRYVDRGAVPSVMTGSYAVQLEEAYRAMNRERGYRRGSRIGSRPRYSGRKI